MAALRIGGFFMPLYYSHVITIPSELTIINGRRNLKFEFGFGLTYLKTITRERPYDGTFVEDMQALLPFLRLGARYQAPGKPFFMRAGITPYVHKEQHVSSPASEFMPWGGISVGYSFGK